MWICSVFWVCPKFHSSFIMLSLFLSLAPARALSFCVCSTQSVHRHTFTRILFPFRLCSNSRSLCDGCFLPCQIYISNRRMPLLFIDFLWKMACFEYNWNVCIYGCIQTKNRIYLQWRGTDFNYRYTTYLYVYIYFTNGTNEHYAILIFPHFMHSSQCPLVHIWFHLFIMNSLLFPLIVHEYEYEFEYMTIWDCMLPTWWLCVWIDHNIRCR